MRHQSCYFGPFAGFLLSSCGYRAVSNSAYENSALIE